MHKDVRQLRKALRKQGFTVVIRKGGHMSAHKGDGPKVTIPVSPSDHRSILNTVALLRRLYGFKWKGR